MTNKYEKCPLRKVKISGEKQMCKSTLKGRFGFMNSERAHTWHPETANSTGSGKEKNVKHQVCHWNARIFHFSTVKGKLQRQKSWNSHRHLLFSHHWRKLQINEWTTNYNDWNLTDVFQKYKIKHDLKRAPLGEMEFFVSNRAQTVLRGRVA